MELELIGAGDDWCEFGINKKITDWMTLAKEAFKFCPAIVEQEPEPLKSLRKK